jgi:hypothetical protein
MHEQPPIPAEPRTRTFSKAEKIGLLAEWIIAGLRTSQIATEWAKAGWGDLDPAEVLEVAAEAHRLINLDATSGAEIERAKAVARYQDLIARANEIQDYKTVLRAQTELLRVVAAAEAAQALE